MGNVSETMTYAELQKAFDEHVPECEYIWDNTECPVCVDLMIRLGTIEAKAAADAEQE